MNGAQGAPGSKSYPDPAMFEELSVENRTILLYTGATLVPVPNPLPSRSKARTCLNSGQSLH